jgi:uncharacterized protein YndB with AHSA1/START domain
MNKATASADAIVREIMIEASAERIFTALTQPDELLKWWAAEGKFQAVHVESDLRPGGRWKMRIMGCSGTQSTVTGQYRKIERPHLLVFTWIREEEDGTETEVRWDLEEREGVTKVRVTHSGLSTESLRARNSGWPLILSLLRACVEDKTSAISRRPGIQSQL